MIKGILKNKILWLFFAAALSTYALIADFSIYIKIRTVGPTNLHSSVVSSIFMFSNHRKFKAVDANTWF